MQSRWKTSYELYDLTFNINPIENNSVLTFPPAVPRGWWIITLPLGMQNRFPFEPAARRNAPIDAASPRQTVETSALHNFIASYIPIPTCSHKMLRNIYGWKTTHNIRGRPKEKVELQSSIWEGLEMIEGGDEQKINEHNKGCI